uniref:MARVEL domain-containing protein 3-like n=1 Tax=Monodelphis domestica TaxID=13616 RepID=A0A5F8GA12_MONDO
MHTPLKLPPNWQATGQESYQLNNQSDKKTVKKLHTPEVSYAQTIPQSQYSRMSAHPSRTVLRASMVDAWYLDSLPRRPHQKSCSGKCSNLCSRRGLLQLGELSLSLLVLICAASALSTSTGFFGLGGMRGSPFFVLGYAMNGFPGHGISQLAELDLQYARMKLPSGYCMVGVSCLLLCLALAFLILGCSTSVPEARMLLGVELVTDVLGVLACMLATGLYIHAIQSANASEGCKRREAIYRSAGYTSMSCDILGTEVAACMFALLLMMVYFSGMVYVGLLLRKQPSPKADRQPQTP